ncbi:MAG: response regulator [Anaerolineae bacterium]|nr:response regulator [Anaerolineae bacterium]
MARILIADDDDDFVEQTRLALERAGHEVRACRNGKEAVALFSSYPADVLILDMRMSYTLDGLDALRQIRMGSAIGEPVVIVVSSLDGPIAEIQEQAATLGVAAWLRKPVSAADLLAHVSEPPSG